MTVSYDWKKFKCASAVSRLIPDLSKRTVRWREGGLIFPVSVILLSFGMWLYEEKRRKQFGKIMKITFPSFQKNKSCVN